MINDKTTRDQRLNSRNDRNYKELKIILDVFFYGLGLVWIIERVIAVYF